MYVGLGNLGKVKINLCRNLVPLTARLPKFRKSILFGVKHVLNNSIKTRGNQNLNPSDPIGSFKDWLCFLTSDDVMSASQRQCTLQTICRL